MKGVKRNSKRGIVKIYWSLSTVSFYRNFCSMEFSLYEYELIIIQYEPTVYSNQKHSPPFISFGGNGSVCSSIIYGT